MSRITFTEDQYKNAVSRIVGNRQGEQSSQKGRLPQKEKTFPISDLTKPRLGKFAESKIQEACIRWFDSTYPELRLNLFSIPNERKADIKMNKKGKPYSPHGARMKSLGRRRGVSDLFLAISKWIEPPGYIYHGLFIEIKSEIGKQSIDQKLFENSVKSKGYKYIICRSEQEFEKEVNEYLK